MVNGVFFGSSSTVTSFAAGLGTRTRGRVANGRFFLNRFARARKVSVPARLSQKKWNCKISTFSTYSKKTYHWRHLPYPANTVPPACMIHKMPFFHKEKRQQNVAISARLSILTSTTKNTIYMGTLFAFRHQFICLTMGTQFAIISLKTAHHFSELKIVNFILNLLFE